MRYPGLAMLLLASIASFPVSAAGGSGKASQPGKTVAIKVEPQAWQVRRAKLFKTVDAINTSQGKDKAALADLDATLTAFEKDLVSITPMEVIDLQQVFYAPREMAKTPGNILTIVAMVATLGWYDALRFADESGRAEIVNNEAFFKRAFSEDDATRQMVSFLERQPQEAAEAVTVGIRLAEKFRGNVHYDEQWPTAYGLQRTMCAMQGIKNCPKPDALPAKEWDDAFDQAVARVQRYYRINKE